MLGLRLMVKKGLDAYFLHIYVKTFIEANKRRSSKYVMTERNAWNWLRHTQKLYNSGELKDERVEAFKKLMELAEENRHVNQWV